MAHFTAFSFCLCFFDSELKTKHAPIYDPALAQTLAEYTSAVGSSDLVAVMARFRLSYWWIPLISSKIWCGSGGLEPGAFLQVYTADLTQLFTWTCERCGDLTEVYHHLKTVYDFTKAFQIHIWFRKICFVAQGFEVVELIVDVKNCLQVTTICLLLAGLLPISPESFFFLLLSNGLYLILMMYLWWIRHMLDLLEIWMQL